MQKYGFEVKKCVVAWQQQENRQADGEEILCKGRKCPRGKKNGLKFILKKKVQRY